MNKKITLPRILLYFTLSFIFVFQLVIINIVGAEQLNIVGGVNERGLIGSHYSYIDTMVYEFGMTKKQANEFSVWKKENDNPPISPREAINVSKKMLEDLKLINEKWTWELESVQLMPIWFTLDREDGIELWQYVVVFARRPNPKPTAWSGAVTKIKILVLMNGQAVKPLIYKK